MQNHLLGEIREADMLNINWRWPERVDKLAELLLKSGKLEEIISGKEKANEAIQELYFWVLKSHQRLLLDNTQN